MTNPNPIICCHITPPLQSTPPLTYKSIPSEIFIFNFSIYIWENSQKIDIQQALFSVLILTLVRDAPQYQEPKSEIHLIF